jgi:nucleotide-binding universal stress UspA family protein
MATHGRTGIIHWVWGSITERVIHKSRLPVLLVRPAKASSQTEPGGGNEAS